MGSFVQSFPKTSRYLTPAQPKAGVESHSQQNQFKHPLNPFSTREDEAGISKHTGLRNRHSPTATQYLYSILHNQPHGQTRQDHARLLLPPLSLKMRMQSVYRVCSRKGSKGTEMSENGRQERTGSSESGRLIYHLWVLRSHGRS
jgi:hypothetical protein